MLRPQALSKAAPGSDVAASDVSGDHAGASYIAFEPIYERYAQPMFAFFYRHLRHRQDAEDLTALTFSEALRSSPRYTEQGSFEAWLWSIARHKLKNAQRRRVTIDFDQLATRLVDTAPSPEDHALHAEHVELLQRLLSELPADQQAALRLRYWGEWSFQEIAERLDRSVGAVKMLVQRALATLRARYPQHEQLHLDSTTHVPRSSNALPNKDLASGLLSSIAAVIAFVMRRWRQICFSHSLVALPPARVLVPVRNRNY